MLFTQPEVLMNAAFHFLAQSMLQDNKYAPSVDPKETWFENMHTETSLVSRQSLPPSVHL